MRIIRFLLRYSRRTLALAVGAGAVSGASSAVLLALVSYLLAAKRSPAVWLWPFGGLCLLSPVSRIASELLLTHLGQGTILELRTDLSRRLLSMPYRVLEELGAHRLLAVLSEDVASIGNAVALVPGVCVSAAITLCGVIYLGALSWRTLGLALAFVALGVAGYQLSVRRALAYIRAARGLHDELYRHLRALTDGMKELKMHSGRREAFLTAELHATAADFRRKNEAALRIYTLASNWGQTMLLVVTGWLLFSLPGAGGIARPVVIGYILTLLFLINPISQILTSAPVFSRGNAGLDHLDKLGIDLASEPPEAATGMPAAPRPWHRLELCDVTHAYHREGEDDEFVLGPIDLALAAGELVFVVGGNGSGKTTLIKILVGLYVPDSGEIRLDGERVDDAQREAHRQNFSVVFADFHLFRGLLGLERPELEAEARQYLEVLRLQDKVRVAGGRLSTTELSQGQRKRLALLTAFLEDRPIYVFDEWAADQDPVYKEFFYRQLLPQLKERGKTAVVVTHDDRYYDVADRLIKLENGRVLSDTRTAAAGGERLPDVVAATG
jgi:putative pyoverdin transport system ATP-binding/permease protein